MSDLRELMHSGELQKATRASSRRWLDDSRWKSITIEEYVKYLGEILSMKKELNAPDLPRHRMKGEKFLI